MEKLDQNQIKQKIIYSVNPSWPNLYKVRYVYLMLGKYLSKDTDFFLSTENKLDDLNLSIEEIEKRYNSMEGKNNYVTCLSSSYMLYEILYALNINSKLVKSNNNVINVNIDGKKLTISHYILAINVDDKTIFASLSADLPYIQQGMKTHHFGVNIPYKKELNNGDIQQVYEGDEIKHTVLSEDTLREIDAEIGYLKSYYKYDNANSPSKDYYLQYEDAGLNILKSQFANNRLYYNLKCQSSLFYKMIYPVKLDNGHYYNLIDIDNPVVTEDDLKEKISLVCLCVDGLLNEITNQGNNSIAFSSKDFTIEDWLKEKCITLKDYILKEHANDKEYEIDDNFSYSKWSRKVKKDKLYDDIEYKNVLSILDQTYALLDHIRSRNPQNIVSLLTRLSYHSLNEELILPKDKNKYISNAYLASKFSTLFPYVFSANEITTDFNEENYSEKIVIIKKILELMFSELNINNSMVEDYNSDYSAVFNRLRLYAIKSRKDLSYQIVINIVGDNELGDYYYLYNPRSNVFKQIDALFYWSNEYIIVSDRLKEKINNENKKKR